MAQALYEIVARTPFPGPDAPGSQRAQLAITFRVHGELAGHTVWLDREIATEEAIDLAIRRWISEHGL